MYGDYGHVFLPIGNIENQSAIQSILDAQTVTETAPQRKYHTQLFCFVLNYVPMNSNGHAEKIANIVWDFYPLLGCHDI